MTVRQQHVHLNGRDVRRPHVLGGVHPEPGHPDVYEVVEVGGHGVPHVVCGPVQVGEPAEVAVSHIVGVGIIVDASCTTSMAGEKTNRQSGNW